MKDIYVGIQISKSLDLNVNPMKFLVVIVVQHASVAFTPSQSIRPNISRIRKARSTLKLYKED